MRCFSGVVGRGRRRRFGARGDKFAPTSSTNRPPIPTFGRHGRLPCLPRLLGIGREHGKQGTAGGKTGARQGHGSYTLSVMTRRE